MDKEKSYTMSQCARNLQVTRQAIYIAVRNKRLKAQKVGFQWMISQQQIDDYIQNKYSRRISTYNGKLLFDQKRGEYSAAQAAEMLKVSIQHIYYLLRKGILRHIRKGGAYVIYQEDIESYRQMKESTKDVDKQISI